MSKHHNQQPARQMVDEQPPDKQPTDEQPNEQQPAEQPPVDNQPGGPSVAEDTPQTPAPAEASAPVAPVADSRSVDREAERQERQNRQTLARQRKVRILIPSGHDEQGRCPVSVGVNGYAYLIERDKEVLVPEGVVNVLRLAKEAVAVRIEERGQIRTEFRESPRFPMQILGYEDA